jgi:hypothetical protein
MTNFYSKLVFIIALVCIANFGFSQSNEIKIQFIGNCGLYLTDGKSNLYIDFPYKSGAYGYMTYAQTKIDSIKENSIFLFTQLSEVFMNKGVCSSMVSDTSLILGQSVTELE